MTDLFQNFKFFYTFLRIRIFLILFIVLLVGILDSFGFFMLVPLLESLEGGNVSVQNGHGPFDLVDKLLAYFNLAFNATNLLFSVFFFFLLKFVINIFCQYLYHGYIQDFLLDIKLKIISSLISVDYLFLQNARKKNEVSFLSVELERVGFALRDFMRFAQQFVFFFLYIALALLISSYLAFLLILFAVFSFIIFNFLFLRTKKMSGDLTLSSNKFEELFAEFILHLKYLKISAYNDKFSVNLSHNVFETDRITKTMGRLSAAMHSLREPFTITFLLFFLYFEVLVNGRHFGTVMLSLLFLYRALTASLQAHVFWDNYLSFSGSVTYVKNLLTSMNLNKKIYGDQPFNNLKSSISFINVSFSYGSEILFRDVNLKIVKGEIIALIGTSGSGKTTFLDLVSGLLAPTAGHIFIDDKCLNSYDLSTYQRRIGYVTQDPVIFNDSIFNNVTLWDRPSSENLKRFENAIIGAGIFDLINNLDDKAFTKLAFNGMNLSGGQKQRIAIARELYKNVDILLLDEPTSSLDSYNEDVIQEAIDRLRGSCTILIITHRLSCLEGYDRVFHFSDYSVLVSSPLFKN